MLRETNDHDLLEVITGRRVRAATQTEIDTAKAHPRRVIQIEGQWFMLSAPRVEWVG
jgi:hypothetical protein